MEHQQPTGSTDSSVSTKRPHRVFQVTGLSKYLAAILFIILPFCGAYLGYSKGTSQTPAYVPVSNATAENLNQNEITLSEETYSGPALAETLALTVESPLHTEIKDKLLTFYKDLIEARGGLSPLNPGVSIAITGVEMGTLFVESWFTTADDTVHATYSLATYEPKTEAIEITRKLDEYHSYYYGTPRTWTVSSPGYTKAVLVQAEDTPDSFNSPNTIALYDFMTGKRSVLYTETDPTVTLAAMCDAGCVGPLYALANELLYCRYEKIPQSIETKFIECREITIPE